MADTLQVLRLQGTHALAAYPALAAATADPSVVAHVEVPPLVAKKKKLQGTWLQRGVLACTHALARSGRWGADVTVQVCLVAACNAPQTRVPCAI